MRNPRDGSVLLAVLICTLVCGLIGIVLVDRSRQSAIEALWTREHLALRMLAESGIEELALSLSEQANQPSAPVFRALRTAPLARGARPVPLPGLSLVNLRVDAAELGTMLGGRVTVRPAAWLESLASLSADPMERTGLAALEVAVELKRSSGAPLVERVRVLREIRVARVLPPRPLDQVGLFIVHTSAEDLGPADRMAYALAAESPHTLSDLLLRASRDGFQLVPTSGRDGVLLALGSLSPDSLKRRAHLVIPDRQQLAQLLARDALNGVVHLSFDQPIRLAFPRFRGRCLISASGPVEVGDIALDDPARDSLTIVSGSRIVVAGHEVAASLICPAGGPGGVLFRQRAVVHSTVVSGRFPRRAGISQQDFADCQFTSSPGSASGAGPDDRSLAAYVAVLAPSPSGVEHNPGGAAW